MRQGASLGRRRGGGGGGGLAAAAAAAAPRPPPRRRPAPRAAGAAGAPADTASAAARLDALAAQVTAQAAALDELRGQLAAARAAAAAPPSLFAAPPAPAPPPPGAPPDRRAAGLYDARFHSTAGGAVPRDARVLPRRIILVRHAQSMGNIDEAAYTYTPDPQVPLTPEGWAQAEQAGRDIKQLMDADGEPYRLYWYTSPYRRSRETYIGAARALGGAALAGAQEEVQLREQDFGNFQDAAAKVREKAERLRFGRFFYRFPNGESGADVYDRLTIFEDHLVRDINAGRFGRDTSLVLVTHGLALRIFLMRWFHWTVDQFMEVYNPPNAAPLVMERVDPPGGGSWAAAGWAGGEEADAFYAGASRDAADGGAGADGFANAHSPPAWVHTKALYRLSAASCAVLEGCTPDMGTSRFELAMARRGRGGRGPPEVHELMLSNEELISGSGEPAGAPGGGGAGGA